MTLTPQTNVDSFQFLWEQIEKEARYLVTDTKDILAVVGVFYVARKFCTIVSNIVEVINVHILSQRHVMWVERYGPWAVVTGSSEGIGHAYAHELALRGLNIVLISRNERKLLKAKSAIERDCHVQVEYIVADFASNNQQELYKYITERLSDKDIGLLVNNVGVMYDYPDTLENVSRQKLWQLIYVNIGAATMMTHILLPGMIERGKGGVIVISSGSSTKITPQMTVYSATKRYLDYFIHGLAFEYRHTNITFQCLIPFYVATRMTGHLDSQSKSSILIPNAVTYARNAVKTLGKSSCTTGYLPHTVQLWIARVIPLRLWMWGSEKLNNSLRKEALSRLANRPPKSSSSGTLHDLSSGH